uniref:C-type lectin domain-containing protein n=1 Tax=Poecilia reticulata TaxID=8081 RepID=A0A3P9NX58_POERE
MKKWKPNWYFVVIGILSGLVATLMALFIREFVNNQDLRTSLEQMQLACSRCLPGWKEHASRCFFLSDVDKEWENARIDCLHHKGDLAMVHNAEDQAFLTNLTFQFKKANPDTNFHSAWIGLQDLVKEGSFFWVNGDKLKLDVRFWRPGKPNNSVATRDTEQAGLDCVSILPPDAAGPEGWMNSWDDISCAGKRHYICETDALILKCRHGHS